MELKDLQDAAEAIKDSSAYAYGDPLTFKTPLKRYEADFPAPCDPHDYMGLLARKFGVEIPKGGRVAVVGAGLGGLCGLALMEGAKEVVAIEPRFRFKPGLTMVVGLLTKMYGEVVRTFLAWPNADTRKSIGQFDLILWPEGTEEMTEPIETFKMIMGLLAPGGKIAVEFRTGDNPNVPAGRINSWLPTPHAVAEFLDMLEVPSPSLPLPGRMQNRVICVALRSVGVKVTPAPDPKPAPKKPVAKKPVAKPAPKPVPKPEPKVEPQPEPIVILPEEEPVEGSSPEEG